MQLPPQTSSPPAHPQLPLLRQTYDEFGHAEQLCPSLPHWL
jgi:hypothetical protein